MDKEWGKVRRIAKVFTDVCVTNDRFMGRLGRLAPDFERSAGFTRPWVVATRPGYQSPNFERLDLDQRQSDIPIVNDSDNLIYRKGSRRRYCSME